MVVTMGTLALILIGAGLLVAWCEDRDAAFKAKLKNEREDRERERFQRECRERDERRELAQRRRAQYRAQRKM
jgi:hypothetical protein